MVRPEANKLYSCCCLLKFIYTTQVHPKKRSRLLSTRLSDLVFVKVNSRLIDKKENKKRDPIEKIVDDVVEDDENEFITGIVPKAQQEQPDTHEPEASTSQAQGKRRAHARKKRKKSVHSLLNCVQEDAVLSDSSSSSASEREGNQPQDYDILSDASSDSD